MALGPWPMALAQGHQGTHPLVQALQVSGEGVNALGVQEALDYVRRLQPANGEGVPAGRHGGVQRVGGGGSRGEALPAHDPALNSPVS